MCTGAISGFAMLKFSTSPSRLGDNEQSVIRAIAIRIIGMVSLIINKGLNFTLSLLKIVVEGLVLPFS